MLETLLVDEGELREVVLDEAVEWRPLRPPRAVDRGGLPHEEERPREDEREERHRRRQDAREAPAVSREPPNPRGEIEDLIHELRGRYSVLIVTHNMQQASRTSDYTAFMYLGHVIEYGPTKDMFLNPHLKETADYITGRFG